MELRLWSLRVLARIPELTSTFSSISSSSFLSNFIPYHLDLPSTYDMVFRRGVMLISGHQLTVDRPRMVVRMIVSPPCPVCTDSDK